MGRRGGEAGAQCCTYRAGGDLSTGRAMKSQRKMASPTLMTCRWSGVKATWRTGSEWPMYTWERARPELHHAPGRQDSGLHAVVPGHPGKEAAVYAPQQRLSTEASTAPAVPKPMFGLKCADPEKRAGDESPQALIPALNTSETLSKPFPSVHGSVPSREVTATSVLCTGSR